MINIEKEKVTLSLPTETDDKLEFFIKENGMTVRPSKLLDQQNCRGGNYLRIKIRGQALIGFSTLLYHSLASQER